MRACNVMMEITREGGRSKGITYKMTRELVGNVYRIIANNTRMISSTVRRKYVSFFFFFFFSTNDESSSILLF